MFGCITYRSFLFCMKKKKQVGTENLILLKQKKKNYVYEITTFRIKNISLK